MIVKVKNDWKIWRDCSPSSVTCNHGQNCDCIYHVIKDGSSESYGFKTWQEAEDDFCQRSGANKFIPGKTRFDGESLT